MGCIMDVTGCPCDNKVGDLKCALRIAAQKRRNNRHKRCRCMVWRPKCLKIRRKPRPCTCNNPHCDKKASIPLFSIPSAPFESSATMGGCPPNCKCKKPPAEPVISKTPSCPIDCKCKCACKKPAGDTANFTSALNFQPLNSAPMIKPSDQTNKPLASCLKPSGSCKAYTPLCLMGKQGNTNISTPCTCSNPLCEKKTSQHVSMLTPPLLPTTPDEEPDTCPPNCTCKCDCKKKSESGDASKPLLACPINCNCKCTCRKSAGDSPNLKSALAPPRSAPLVRTPQYPAGSVLTSNTRENQTNSVSLRSRSPSPNVDGENKNIKRFTIDAYFT